MKQAFDNVSLENLSLVMKEMEIAPTLAGAILREQKDPPVDYFLLNCASVSTVSSAFLLDVCAFAATVPDLELEAAAPVLDSARTLALSKQLSTR